MITEQDHYWMRRALQLAEKAAEQGEVPVGAIIVRGDEVIGSGYNMRETKQHPLAHAELLAIDEASRTLKSWRLSDCQLYVTLEPCPMCAGAIIQSRLSRVIYGAYDHKAGYAGTLHNTLRDERLNHQVELVSGVRQAECQAVLQAFFQELRKRSKT